MAASPSWSGPEVRSCNKRRVIVLVLILVLKATITITSPDDISAIDFGHTGWHLLNDVVSITLNVIAANTQVSNCVLRTDHARPSMTPFGPLTTIDTNTLCSS